MLKTSKNNPIPHQVKNIHYPIGWIVISSQSKIRLTFKRFTYFLRDVWKKTLYTQALKSQAIQVITRYPYNGPEALSCASVKKNCLLKTFLRTKTRTLICQRRLVLIIFSRSVSLCWRGPQLKTTALLVSFMWLIISFKNL